MKVHSQVDLITNSSTEMFVVKKPLSEVKEVLVGSGRPCSDCPYKEQNNWGDPILWVEEFTQSDWEDCKRYNEFPPCNVGDVKVSYDINMVDGEELEKYLVEKFGQENVDPE